MDLNFDCKDVYISANSNRTVCLNIKGAEEIDILEHFSLNDIIGHFGASKLLNEIGEDAAKYQFGLVNLE